MEQGSGFRRVSGTDLLSPSSRVGWLKVNMSMSVCTVAAMRMYLGRRAPRLQTERSSRSCAAAQNVLAAASSPGWAQKRLQQQRTHDVWIHSSRRIQECV